MKNKRLAQCVLEDISKIRLGRVRVSNARKEHLHEKKDRKMSLIAYPYVGTVLTHLLA